MPLLSSKMHLICPTVGICAINRTINTLIRDNLYQDNTHMIQSLSANDIEIHFLPKYVHFNGLKLSGALE